MLKKDISGELSETAQKDIFYITDAAMRMQKLIQDLLWFSRAGMSAMKPQRISLNECADRAIEALSTRIQETKTRITRDELKEVFGDPTLLMQLYQNLISNAIKFVRDRTPEIHLSCEDQNGTPVFGVKDNGIGIKPEHATMIFAPFKRLHGREEFRGEGIGLSICRKVVERHFGRIWVESEFGQGSHFRFTIGEMEE
jgi:light-regulated signal transduction histidine kinase (bacteriophytochrome)